MAEWEAVVGLEIHVHLKTRTKMFCRCELEYFAEPNTRTCPVCLAHPGRAAGREPQGGRVDDQARPRARLRDRRRGRLRAEELLLSRQPEGLPDLAVRPAALRRRLAARARDRTATARSASCARTSRRTLRRRCTSAAGPGARSAPPTRSSTSTAAARRSSRSSRSRTSARPTRRCASSACCGRRSSSSASPTRRWRRARCASTRTCPCGRAGSDELRTRWELKNMNSFTFIGRGIEAAVRDQIALYEQGAAVEQHTYDYEPENDRLTPHRAKEEADDYRYFPEPDLVPVRPEPALVEQLRGELPELPGQRDRAPARRARRGDCADARHRRPRRALGGDARRRRRARRRGERDREPARRRRRRSRARRCRASSRSSSRRATRSRARRSTTRSRTRETTASAPIRTSSRRRVADTSQLEPIVDEVLAQNAGQVEAYRGGKSGLLGFFVGQVMKGTNGQADARVVNELVREKLDA